MCGPDAYRQKNDTSPLPRTYRLARRWQDQARRRSEAGPFVEYSRYRKIRPMLFQGVGRRVLDAGVGTGRNIQFYPPGAEAVGVDLEFQDQSFDALVKYVFFR